MGFTGSKAAQFKVGYIERYNSLENYVGNRLEARVEYRMLMESVVDNAPRPNQWLCPNEANMINVIVLGKRAKAFRKENGIQDNETRAYQTAQEIECINRLQKVDFGLLEAGLNYQQRKTTLTKYFQNKLAPKVGIIA